MATAADFTTRTRDEMCAIYQAYQAIGKRVQDITDEISALGGPTGVYGAAGVNFPAQGDGFTYADMVAAYTALTAFVAAPTGAQKNAVIKARRE